MSEQAMIVSDEEAEASARDDIARRGRVLYETRLKAVLEPAYNNRFVAIHPDSGEYAVADSTGNSMRAIRKNRPQGRLYLTKIGPEPETELAIRILGAEALAEMPQLPRIAGATGEPPHRALVRADAVKGYNLNMSVTEIQTAIVELPPSELADLLEWIEEYRADAWDKQIAQDVEAGRFDTLRQRVKEQRQAGLCQPL